jgi:hypothetical protein
MQQIAKAGRVRNTKEFTNFIVHTAKPGPRWLLTNRAGGIVMLDFSR